MRTPVALPPFTERCSAMQMRRFIKFLSFSDWLKKAPQLRDEAESSPHDTEEDSTIEPGRHRRLDRQVDVVAGFEASRIAFRQRRSMKRIVRGGVGEICSAFLSSPLRPA
jgi:hypothetical protein